MRQIAYIFGVVGLLLAACTPSITVENQVLPSLYSVTVPETGEETLVLQGRYFGDGFGGASEGSYVIVGADVQGDGGLRLNAESWTPSRIALSVPEGAGSGFVFVVVDGVRSNGLPANLP